MIVAITSSKGGAGKTTLTAIATASMYAYTDASIVVVDLDPQASFSNKRERETEELTEIHVNTNMYRTMNKSFERKGKPFNDVETIDLFADFKSIKNKLKDLEKKYDLVFLDFPGSMNLHKNTLALLTVLDRIFVPFYVDENTFDSTFPFTKSLYEFKRTGKTKADIYVFFNKYRDSGKNASLFKKVNEFLKSNDMNVMNNHVYEDITIERYHTVVPPRRSQAPKNVHHWVEEMYEMINHKT